MEQDFGGEQNPEYGPDVKDEFIRLWEADNRLDALKLVWGENIDMAQSESHLDVVALLEVEDGSDAYEMAIAAKGINDFYTF